MEASTPFLSYYIFFRTRYPFCTDVNIAKTIFGLLFLVFRMIINTYGAYVFVKSYFGPQVTMPAYVPQWKQLSMLAIIIAGAVLQLFWGAKILRGLVKPAKKKM